ncbi:KCNH6 [Symbiodinium sp. CCMP2592]|nr:KCNH6 [Symbiodinium sp. CCMP2592]
MEPGGVSFPEFVSQSLDKLKETLLAAYTESHNPNDGAVPRKSAASARPARVSVHHADEEAGFCCSRTRSRGMTLNVDSQPLPYSSWQPASELGEAYPMIEGEEIFSQHSSREDLRTLPKWESLLLPALEGGLAADRRIQMPAEYFSIHPQWSAGTKVTVRKSHAAKQGSVRPSVSVMRVKSLLVDEASIMQRFVFHPDALPRLAWLCFGMLLIFWDVVTIPLILGGVDNATMDFLYWASFVTLAYWIFDLFVNFLTGYDTGAGIEMRPRQIAWHYSKCWFIPDVILVLIELVIKILEFVANSIESSEELGSVRVLRIVRVMRFLRLLRLQKIARIGELIAKHFTSLTFWLTAKIASGMVFILVVNHYLAIFFMAIGLQGKQDGVRSWLIAYEVEDTDFWDIYAISLHWSLTQFTPATNNIGPVNSLERLFAICVVLVALALFSSFLSSITNAVTALRAVRLDYETREAQIRQFFNERNLPASLLAQVKAFMRMRSSAIRRVLEKDVKLLAELPDALKKKLHAEMFLSPISALPWMPSILRESTEFLEKVCHGAVDERIARPGIDIFVPDSESEGAIIASSDGLVYTRREVFLRYKQNFNNSTGVVALRPGMRLAEVGLWAVWRHRGHLTTETTCPYLFINAVDFAEIAQQHGGTTFKYLHIFGLLYVSHVEDIMDKGVLSDLSAEQDELQTLGRRAQTFMDLSSRDTTISGFGQI